MSGPPISLEGVAELASQLPPEDQLRLVAHIGQRLGATLSSAKPLEPVSSSPSLAILRVMHDEPRLTSEDVDESDRMIASGRLEVRPEGIFDREDHG